MKPFALLAGLALILTSPTWATAQNYAPASYARVEVGAYGSFLRFNPSGNSTNFVGVGGRLDFNAARYLGIEAQMDYDFAKNYTTTYSGNNSGGVNTSFVTTGLRPLTGLVRPALSGRHRRPGHGLCHRSGGVHRLLHQQPQ